MLRGGCGLSRAMRVRSTDTGECSGCWAHTEWTPPSTAATMNTGSCTPVEVITCAIARQPFPRLRPLPALLSPSARSSIAPLRPFRRHRSFRRRSGEGSLQPGWTTPRSECRGANQPVCRSAMSRCRVDRGRRAAVQPLVRASQRPRRGVRGQSRRQGLPSLTPCVLARWRPALTLSAMRSLSN